MPRDDALAPAVAVVGARSVHPLLDSIFATALGRAALEFDQTLVARRARGEHRRAVVLDPGVRGEVWLGTRGEDDDAPQRASSQQPVEDERAHKTAVIGRDERERSRNRPAEAPGERVVAVSLALVLAAQLGNDRANVPSSHPPSNDDVVAENLRDEAQIGGSGQGRTAPWAGGPHWGLPPAAARPRRLALRVVWAHVVWPQIIRVGG